MIVKTDLLDNIEILKDYQHQQEHVQLDIIAKLNHNFKQQKLLIQLIIIMVHDQLEAIVLQELVNQLNVLLELIMLQIKRLLLLTASTDQLELIELIAEDQLMD